MKWMQLKYIFSKTSKKQILMVALQSYEKSASKDFMKTFCTHFFSDFFAAFFRPYPNVKIILTFSYTIETTLSKLHYYLKFITNTFTSFTFSKVVGFFGFFKLTSLYIHQIEDSFL